MEAQQQAVPPVQAGDERFAFESFHSVILATCRLACCADSGLALLTAGNGGKGKLPTVFRPLLCEQVTPGKPGLHAVVGRKAGDSGQATRGSSVVYAPVVRECGRCERTGGAATREINVVNRER